MARKITIYIKMAALFLGIWHCINIFSTTSESECWLNILNFLCFLSIDIWILETSGLLMSSEEKYRWMEILSVIWKLWNFSKMRGQIQLLPNKRTRLNSQHILTFLLLPNSAMCPACYSCIYKITSRFLDWLCNQWFYLSI